MRVYPNKGDDRRLKVQITDMERVGKRKKSSAGMTLYFDAHDTTTPAVVRDYLRRLIAEKGSTCLSSHQENSE
jgi:hypothetical protein